MIFGGAAERYPNVRVIFAHGGGTMPYLDRAVHQYGKRPEIFAELLPQGFSGAASKSLLRHGVDLLNAVAMGALIKVVPLSQKSCWVRIIQPAMRSQINT